MNNPQMMTDPKQCHNKGCMKCMSGKAVFVGALVAIGLGFLLNLFSAAIGLTAYTKSPEGALTLAIGGYIGVAIGVMVIMFVAGWVSGFLGRCSCVSNYNCNIGVLYGFTTWALALIITILLTTNIMNFTALQYEAFTVPNSAASKMMSMTGTSTSENAMTRASSNQAAKAMTASDEKTAKTLGTSLLLIFILFFVGAIMASYGGYVGMKSRKSKM